MWRLRRKARLDTRVSRLTSRRRRLLRISPHSVQTVKHKQQHGIGQYFSCGTKPDFHACLAEVCRLPMWLLMRYSASDSSAGWWQLPFWSHSGGTSNIWLQCHCLQHILSGLQCYIRRIGFRKLVGINLFQFSRNCLCKLVSLYFEELSTSLTVWFHLNFHHSTVRHKQHAKLFGKLSFALLPLWPLMWGDELNNLVKTVKMTKETGILDNLI